MTATNPKRLSIILAEDHNMVAGGLQLLLEPEFEVLEVVGNGIEAVEVCRKRRPDIVILDISLPQMNGLEALREIKKDLSRARVVMRVVMLTGMADVTVATEAFRLGANGYVLKHSAPTELLTALREVAQGRTYITPRIANDVLQRLMAPSSKNESGPNLTARERQILQLIAEGKSSKEAGASLGVTPRTVEFHKRNLMEKTGLRSTAELARYAAEKGLVSKVGNDL